MAKKLYLFVVFIFLIFNAQGVVGQRQVMKTSIKGLVRDSISKEALPFVAVFLKGSDKGGLTDENGEFSISTSVNFINVSISTLGYKDKEVFVNKGKDNDIIIDLVPSGVSLKEVVVKPKREKYSKKNNPAVEFVEKLMARKRMYDPKNHEYYNYDKYEKMNFGLNDFSEEQKKKWI